MTAEVLINRSLYVTDDGEPNSVHDSVESVKEAMIEFAKYHVEQALKAADNNATIDIIDREEISEGSFRPIYGVDSKSILNAYPLENIK